jgi:hypothetical protein
MTVLHRMNLSQTRVHQPSLPVSLDATRTSASLIPGEGIQCDLPSRSVFAKLVNEYSHQL